MSLISWRLILECALRMRMFEAIGGGKNAAERLLFEKASSAYWRLRFAAPLTFWGVARKKEGESVDCGRRLNGYFVHYFFTS